MRATIVWTLRQRRYVRLLAAMAIVAALCTGMGFFEAHRYAEKRTENHGLLAAAAAGTVALTPSLVPLVSVGGRQPSVPIFRQVTATGTYLADRQTYVADVQQDGQQGFYVLTPLQTTDGVLLVARGFVAADADGLRPEVVTSPPGGTVTVTGRVNAGSKRPQQSSRLGHDEVMSVDPTAVAAQLGRPVYGGWVALAAGSPGADGLSPLPQPDLDNPSGGASQWQLMSYVVQWFAFALLALLAPFFFSRNELKDARRRFLGVDEDAVEIDEITDVDRVLPLSGRVGRGPAALTGGRVAQLTARESVGEKAEMQAVGPESQGPAELARLQAVELRVRRAQVLADRYGQSLTLADRDRHRPEPQPDATQPVTRRDDSVRVHVSPQVTVESSRTPHRSVDEVHAGYNDYLWQLAMADGELLEPDLDLDVRPLDGAGYVTPQPTVIDVEPADRDEPSR